MKIGESLQIVNGNLVHNEAWDPNVGLKQAERDRHAIQAKGGKLLNFVGEDIGEPQYSYPAWLEQLWSQQWGVRMDDPAFDDVIQMELNSGQYEKFRVS